MGYSDHQPSGAAKVAALLLAMDRSLATRLLKRFSPDEIREITRCASDLGAVSATSLQLFVNEFSGEFHSGGDLVGSTDSAQELISDALPPEEVTDIIADLTGRSNSTVWQKVAALDPKVLHDYLRKEHVQSITLVVARMESSAAAQLMMLMEPRDQVEVTRRLAVMKPPAQSILGILERRLKQDLLLVAPRAAAQSERQIADIINRMDKRHIDEILGSLSKTNAELATAVKKMLFDFEDIGVLSAQDRAIVFDKAPLEKVIVSLNDSSLEFRELVLSSLTNRARRMVEQELASAKSMPPKEIQTARKMIADLVLELGGRGEIIIPPPPEDTSEAA